jgi:hypothetical protein
MRALSERQYHGGRSIEVSDPIEASLLGWLRILKYGPPRPILDRVGGPADAVIFTDGSTAEDGSGDDPRIGGVSLLWWNRSSAAFSIPVPEDLIKSWLPTKNSITLIEIFAAVAAIEHHGPELVGKRVTMLIDSEAALDALIKGYSNSEDVALIVTAFWEIVARHQINVYLDRVPTDFNISDGMSRARIQEIVALGWTRVYPDLQRVVGRNSEIRKDLGLSNKRSCSGTQLFRVAKKRKTQAQSDPKESGPGTAAPSAGASHPATHGPVNH